MALDSKGSLIQQFKESKLQRRLRVEMVERAHLPV